MLMGTAKPTKAQNELTQLNQKYREQKQEVEML